jgi:hypothetical protein
MLQVLARKLESGQREYFDVLKVTFDLHVVLRDNTET